MILMQINRELETKLFEMMRQAQRQIDESGIELEDTEAHPNLAQFHVLMWLWAYNDLADVAPCLKDLVTFLQAQEIQGNPNFSSGYFDSECLELLDQYEEELR